MAKKPTRRKRDKKPADPRAYDARMRRAELRKVIAVERQAAKLAKQYETIARAGAAAALELAEGIANYRGLVLVPLDPTRPISDHAIDQLARLVRERPELLELLLPAGVAAGQA